VSLSWAETLEVTLHPEHIRVKRSALLPGRGGGEQVWPVAGGAAGDEPWRAALQRLDDVLGEARAAQAALRVMVSDHFVRYALIPWSAELVADSERMAFARLTMREIFGPAADLWELCLDQQPAGQSSFAAAMDRALLAGLRDLSHKHRLRLRAVKPMLSARVQRQQRNLKESSFCFASLEAGRLMLAFYGDRGWCAVRGRLLGDAPGEELAAALKQEAAASGASANGTLYLTADDLGDLPPFSVSGWKIVRLATPAASSVLRARLRPAFLRS
jgi:hypothetical protein